MTRKQSPFAALQGFRREYCIRSNLRIASDTTVWAMDIQDAEEQFTALNVPVTFGCRVSSVRRVDEETPETLRPIPNVASDEELKRHL